MKDLAKAREKVEALVNHSSRTVKIFNNAHRWIRRSDVLAILGEEEFERTVRSANGKFDTIHVSSNERKGQRREKIRRGHDIFPASEKMTGNYYGRRSGEERRSHE